MINVLFAALPDRWDEFAPHLKTAFAAAGLKADLRQDFPPENVDYIVYAPNGALQDFTPYTRCKAVLSLWAGVEQIVTNKTLTQPLCRMVDPGLTQAMVEWVTGHVLRYHLGMDANLANQSTWEPVAPPLAQDRSVGILGLGALGAACGQALAQLGFDVHGWSRREKQIEGITCHHGDEGLRDALKQSEILTLLLPDTAATTNVLNPETLALMPKGAFILNPGRGPLIEDDALLEALDNGQIAHATLDVFRIEPLSADDPYWSHPNVTVTPHIAAATRASTAAGVIAENIRRGEAGEALLHLVDRAQGY